MWTRMIGSWGVSFVYAAVVFFFKPTTAYEMRISGGSSDVCCSDLPVLAALPRRPRRGAADLRDAAGDRRAARLYRPRRHGGRRALHEIGSASGRERVCQYV